MTRYLLNHFSTTGLVMLVVGGSTLVALVATVALRKAYPSLHERAGRFEETVVVLRRDLFSFVYAVVLALSIADLSGNVSAASSTVAGEANALAKLASSAGVFPAQTSDAINDSLREYVHAVVDDEWPSMRTGQSSPRAAAALEALNAVYQGLTPQTAVEQTYYSASVDDLGQVTLARRERLLESQVSLSPLLRILLVVGGIVFVVLGFPAAVRSMSARLLLVGIAAAFLSFAYLLTMVLDYPFAGQTAVSTAPFKQGALARYWAFDGPPRQLGPQMVARLSPADLAGVWNSDNGFGVMVFRVEGSEVRGVYRNDEGTIVGRIGGDGVLRGWWCQEPGRTTPGNAGEVEWRLLHTTGGQRRVLDGRWKFGAGEGFRGGWDLTWITETEPADLAPLFDDPSAFCPHP